MKLNLLLSRLLAIVFLFIQTFLPIVQYSGIEFIQQILPEVEATFLQDNNQGVGLIDFLNSPEGIVLLTNMTHDTSSGTVSLTTPAAGSVVLSEMQPNSYRTRYDLEVTLGIGSTSDITVDINDCNSTMIGSGIPLVGGKVDLSPYNGYACIQPILNVVNGSPAPVISEVKLSREPLPYYAVAIEAPEEKNACKTLTYLAKVSLSYVDDKDVVVYVPLPKEANNTIYNQTSAYNQNLDPSFSTALQGGIYTAGSKIITTIGGKDITIPENSVYREFEEMTAGDTLVLPFMVEVPCGIENGVIYEVQAYVDGNAGDANFTDPVMTTILSQPDPHIDKYAINTIDTKSKYADPGKGRHIMYMPEVSSNGVVEYEIMVGNGVNSSVGYVNLVPETINETLFNPTIIDDLTNLASFFQSCSGSFPKDLQSRVILNNNGYRSGNVATWDLQDMQVKKSEVVSFTVNFEGCAEDEFTSFENTAILSADNMIDISHSHEVEFHATFPGIGLYNKCAENHERESGDCEDGTEWAEYYGEKFHYTLSLNNKGPARLDDVVVFDRIPEESSLSAAVTIDEDVDYTIRYNSVDSDMNATGGIYPDYTYLTGTGLTFGPNWTTSPSSYTDVNWIAVEVSCLNSGVEEYVSPVGSSCFDASFSAIAKVPVVMNTPVDECEVTNFENTGYFHSYIQSSATGNTDDDMLVLDSPISDTLERKFIGLPNEPNINITPSSYVGPTDLYVGEVGLYTLEFENTGSDISPSTSVVFDVPQVLSNGVAQYVSMNLLSTDSSYTVDQSGLPSQIVLDLGEFLPGEVVDIEFELTLPSGIVEGETITIPATISTSDNLCLEKTYLAEVYTTIHGNPQLTNYKQRDLSFIKSNEEIGYHFFANNFGTATSTDTFVVDRIPEGTELIEAYTAGTARDGTVYSCSGCEVYFAPSVGSLPSQINPLDPITSELVIHNFTLGNETSPGVWNSPFSSPVRVAFSLDDPAVGGFPVGSISQFGFSAKDVDHSFGDIIRNVGGIISNENLQGISNQVVTTLFDMPGLQINMSSDKDVIQACEDFLRTVDYYNDASDVNDTTIVTTTFPDTVQIDMANIGHLWNDQAIVNGEINTGNVNISSFLSGGQLVDGSRLIEIDIHQLPTTGLLGSLEGGTLTFPASSNCDNPSGTLLVANTAGEFANSIAQGVVTNDDPVIVQNADLEIIKRVDQFSPLPGDTVTYTLEIKNRGTHEATDIGITDTLPVGGCYVAGSAAAIGVDRDIDEPTVNGICGADTAVDLTRDGVLGFAPGGTFSGPYGEGVLPGLSESVFITYEVLIQTVPDGTILTNGVGVTTTNPEDTIYTNTGSVSVMVPFPDPTVDITTPYSILPGVTYDYQIIYNNNNRTCADDVYLVHTVPDSLPKSTGGDGNPDITITNVQVGNEETVYYSTVSPAGGSAPMFDPVAPSADWSTVYPSIPITYIALTAGTLCDVDGAFGITVTAQATDPNTGVDLPIGSEFFYPVMIDASNEPDEGPEESNNNAIDESIIPGIDLTIEIEGMPQGSFPGNIPGGQQVYEVTYGNSGVSPSCSNYIDIFLDPLTQPQANVTDFTTINLFDQGGNSTNPVDAAVGGITVTDQTELEVDCQYESATHSVHCILGNPSSNICIPSGATGSFNIYTTVDPSAQDGDVIAAAASIGENDVGIEEKTIENNDNVTTTTIYRAELLVRKEGRSNLTGSLTATGNNNITAPGEIITYKVEYTNIGNTNAENTIITEDIPVGACLDVSTLVEGLPAGSDIDYYDSNGDVIGAGSGVNCDVRSVKIHLGTILAPPGTDGERCTLQGTTTAYYSFDEENLLDESGNGNHAEGHGGLTFGSISGGPAVLLDGIDDYISLPPGLLNSSQGTIAFWTTAPFSFVGTIFDAGVFTLDRTGFSNTRNYLTGSVFGGSGFGRENHVIATWKNGEITFALNGNLRTDPRIADLSLLDSYLGVNFGSTNNGSSDFNKSWIDEVYILNYQIDEDEARELYNGTYESRSSDCELGSFAGGGSGVTDQHLNFFGDSIGSQDALSLGKEPFLRSVLEISESSGGGPAVGSNTNYGNSISGIGDLDQDGVPDLLVGARYYGYPDGRGGVFVNFMNADGTVKSYQELSSGIGGAPVLDAEDAYGYSLANLGDMNGDGITDIAVGAYADDDGGSNAGALYIQFMNIDGTVQSYQKISNLSGSLDVSLPANGLYGASVANLGDLDGDGVIDIAAGGHGEVYIHYLNNDGTVKSSLQYVSQGSGYGVNILNMGDLDGDGNIDIAVGNHYDRELYIHFLNGDGTIKSTTLIADGFGGLPIDTTIGYYAYRLTNLGDINGDNINDIGIGTFDTNGWYIHLLDRDGTVKETKLISDKLSDDIPDFYGVGVFSLDLDGDGVNEVVVGNADEELYVHSLLFDQFYPVGQYSTLLEADPAYSLSMREKLLVEYDTPTGTSVDVRITDGIPQTDGSCDGNIVYDHVGTLTNGYIDLSNELDPNVLTYCLEFTLATSDPQATPTIDARYATYRTTELPSFLFDVHVATDTADLIGVTDITNNVSIQTDTPEMTGANNTDIHRHDFFLTDLEVDKTVSHASAIAGDTLTYTIDYENKGPNTVLESTITDSLSANVDLSSFTPGAGPTPVLAGNIVTWSFGPIDPYTSGSLDYTVAILEGLSNGSVITNTAHIDTDSLETDYTNNNDSVNTIIGDYANVYTTISCDPVACMAQDYMCTVTYGNNGNEDATDVTVKIDLDDQVEVVSSFLSPICTNNLGTSGSIDCDIGTLLTDTQSSFSFVLSSFSGPTVVPNYVTQTDGEKFDFDVSISTNNIEVTDSDNYDSSASATIILCQLSSIAGNIYVDTFDDGTFTPGIDLYVENQLVCIEGTTFQGYTVCAAGCDVIVPCVTTNIDGDYSFSGLEPGNYSTSYTNSTNYGALYSDAGIIDAVGVLGSNGLEYTGTSIGLGTVQSGMPSNPTIPSIAYTTISDIQVGAGQNSMENNFALSAPNLNIGISCESYACITSGYSCTASFENNGTLEADAVQVIIPVGVDQSISDIDNSACVYIPMTIPASTQIGNIVCKDFDLQPGDMQSVSFTATPDNNIQFIADGKIYERNAHIKTETSEPLTQDNLTLQEYVPVQVCETSSVGGKIYIDTDADFIYDVTTNISNPDRIYTGGIVMTLEGMTITGSVVTMSTTTLPDGSYLFSNLKPGEYNVMHAGETGYGNFSSTAGKIDSNSLSTVSGTQTGNGSIQEISILSTHVEDIVLSDGDHSIENDFGIVMANLSTTIDCIGFSGGQGKAYLDEVVSCTSTFSNIGNLDTPDTVGTTIYETATLTLSGPLPTGCIENIPGTIDCDLDIFGINASDIYVFDFDIANDSTFLTDANNSIIFNSSISTSYPEVKYTDNISTDSLPLEAVSNSIAGIVYVDANADYVQQLTGDYVYSGVNVYLEGVDILGVPVMLDTTTDTDGGYQFTNLLPGIYTVLIFEPMSYAGFTSTAGIVDGLSEGLGSIQDNTHSVLSVSNINLISNDHSINNDFGLVQDDCITPVIMTNILPSQGSVIHDPNVTITGEVDDVTALLTIQGVPVANDGGSFSHVLTGGLVNGTNTVLLTAKGADRFCTTTEENQIILDIDHNLTIEKTVNTPTVLDGDRVIYTLDRSHTGPTTAVDTIITDIIPSQLIDLEYSPEPDSYDIETRIASWNIGNLLNTSGSILVSAKVKSGGNEVFDNTTTIGSQTNPERITVDNSDTASVTILDIDVVTDIECTPEAVQQGSTFVCRLDYANLGTSPGTMIDLTNIFTGGMIQLDGSESGALNDISLESQGAGSVTFTVTVPDDNSLIGGYYPIITEISLNDGQVETDYTNNTDDDIVYIIGKSDDSGVGGSKSSNTKDEVEQEKNTGLFYNTVDTQNEQIEVFKKQEIEVIKRITELKDSDSPLGPLILDMKFDKILPDILPRTGGR